MVEPLNLKFSVFTVKLVSVRKFRNFTVMSLSTFYLYIQDNRRICHIQVVKLDLSQSLASFI